MVCRLCDPNLGPIVFECTFWRLVLNRNQDLLGKCFLATRRHIEHVRELQPAEWTELHEQLALASRALELAFQPDHFDYVFLQNQDRHVHLHVVPRYAGTRTFGETVFTDPGFPGHYRIDSPFNRLEPNAEVELAGMLGRLRSLAQSNCLD